MYKPVLRPFNWLNKRLGLSLSVQLMEIKKDVPFQCQYSRLNPVEGIL